MTPLHARQRMARVIAMRPDPLHFLHVISSAFRKEMQLVMRVARRVNVKNFFIFFLSFSWYLKKVIV